MVDLVLFLEIAWCSVFFGCRGRTRAFLCAGGMVVAGYVAAQTDDWLAGVLVPPDSRVFAWMVQQVAAPPNSVAVLSAFLPTRAVTVYNPPGQWLAVSLLRGLFSTAITLAVFLMFVIMSYLLDVYRRAPDAKGRFHGWSLATLLVGAGCGMYCAFLSAVTMADLSFLRPFSFLAAHASGSLGVHAAAAVCEALRRG
ncbi:hypothetical protein [Alicyclobacillus kakegawensis]|uniref:hypothetical protein n=1 Tax=Alicyclobacillus kakegawensis TaxID=392012 RepID=UPI00082AB53B|nr:hypothetical protein [Alicyclobacillus kakegawensis]